MRAELARGHQQNETGVRRTEATRRRRLVGRWLQHQVRPERLRGDQHQRRVAQQVAAEQLDRQPDLEPEQQSQVQSTPHTIFANALGVFFVVAYVRRSFAFLPASVWHHHFICTNTFLLTWPKFLLQRFGGANRIESGLGGLRESELAVQR